MNVTVSRRGLRFVAVILAATVAPLAAGMAQTQPGFDETEAARQKRLLEEQERAGAASQEVLPAADDISYADVLKDPDNIDLNFRYAKAQVARGNVRGAASTLERILLVTPDLPQVRLMYAIVLYRLDNIDEAEREFNALKELKMAGSLEAEIDRFLGAIKQRRQTTTARVQVSLGVKRDSNVNAGSRSGQALAAGLQFAPLGRAQKQDDFAAIGVVTADVTQDLGHQAPEEWYELHLAAWLHDCGKVTTPEFVVDKATKLETIYNRIHEVRARFEILRRDAEIECLKGKLAGGDPAELDAAFEAECRQLEADFAFVAESNLGGEFFAPEDVERLREIGRRVWYRHFDHTLGLSWEEGSRLGKVEPREGPAPQQLLEDRYDHKTPEYDNGELYNLSIVRGTLTAEERKKINDHIVVTINMLEQLPFPRSLRRVPEIAGGHHEKMDGTGYPRGLTRDEMSLPARMMAIADIFEALTAADRPYKKAKMLSECLSIMSFMRNDAHIDPDLFELFLRSGVWREYAEQFLDPGQIDDIDIADYLPENPE